MVDMQGHRSDLKESGSKKIELQIYSPHGDTLLITCRRDVIYRTRDNLSVLHMTMYSFNILNAELFIPLVMPIDYF